MRSRNKKRTAPHCACLNRLQLTSLIVVLMAICISLLSCSKTIYDISIVDRDIKLTLSELEWEIVELRSMPLPSGQDGKLQVSSRNYEKILVAVREDNKVQIAIKVKQGRVSSVIVSFLYPNLVNAKQLENILKERLPIVSNEATKAGRVPLQTNE